MKNDAYVKYYDHRKSAKRRDIEFLLTFEEWWDIWDNSGYWDQRGRGIGKYCMSRYNDTGSYSIGNVFIQLFSKNARDGQIGKIVTLEQRKAISLRKTGQTHSEESKKKMSNSRKGVKFSEERKKRMSSRKGQDNSFYGKTHSEESRKKISESRKGKCVGENNSFYGKTHNDETRKKISEAVRETIRLKKLKRIKE